MDDDGFGFWCALFIAYMFGLATGYYENNRAWEKEAIKAGYAEYDNKTREFHWGIKEY